MTLDDAPHELFQCEATSLHFADLSLVYLMLGPILTPFTLFPSTDLFYGFRILQTLLMGHPEHPRLKNFNRT